MNLLNPEEQQQQFIFNALDTGEHIDIALGFIFQNPGLLFVRNDDGTSCLHIAVEKNMPTFVRAIISDEFIGHINPNNEDRMSASSIGNEILNNPDKNGNSCLHIAAIENRPEILEILINSCVRFNMHSLENLYSFVNKENNKGSSPLLLALKNDNLYVANMLIDYHADVNATLMRTVYNGNIKLAQKLIHLCLDREIPLDVNYVDSDGNTPLSIATRMNNAEIVNLLVQNGAAIRGGKKRNNKSKKRNNKSKKRNYKKRKTFKKFYNV